MNYKDKNWLEQKYVTENLSAKEIGIICGVSHSTILREFRKVGIVTRKVSELHLNDRHRQKCVSNFANMPQKSIDKRKTVCSELYKSKEYKEKMRQITKNNQEAIKESLKVVMSTDEYKINHNISITTDEYRMNASKNSKKLWESQEYRDKVIEKLKLAGAKGRLNCGIKISNIQKSLYSMLDDLGIKYFGERIVNDKICTDIECTIGPWTFDCVIPRENKSTLLIECQGDYWHNLEKQIRIDKAKHNYIINNFKGQYEIKYLWEHEFYSANKVLDTIKYWMGISNIDVVEYDFDSTSILEITAEQCSRVLLKYHYLNNAGRGGIRIGLMLNGDVIAVAVFSPLVRQNLGFDSDKTRELSRFCINPKYRKKNLGSWFLSRAIRIIKNKGYNKIVSYSDTTVNQHGALYKACGFKLDRVVREDYLYVDKSGWTMHKKTLYNHAKKLKMKENEFATMYGYKKIFGLEKYRFVIDL